MTGTQYDVAIVGGGIAGASLAAFLSPATRTAILERETQPGYHTTGRSAAFYAETYGGPDVQPLTTASRAFFDAPPPGFADHPLLTHRGALHVVRDGGLSALDALERDFAASGVVIERLDRAGTRARAPMLRDPWTITSLWEPGCADIDVGALHLGFLKMARANGCEFRADAEVIAIALNGGLWQLQLKSGDMISARVVVNAAGAWVDWFARLAGVPTLGIQPYRRTIAQVIGEPALPGDLPVVIDAGGDWYFKPEADRIWVSPHDEIPDEACDAQPDHYDVATAIDRFEKATTTRVVKLDRAWAGLRNFAPDRLPVFGFDPAAPGWFWCAGQGGFGIQTAPAAGLLCATLIEGRALPDALTRHGITPVRYAPDRLHVAQAA
jgi:D-arginine dehydrogenase